MDKLYDIAAEWLSGAAKAQACGYGSGGPNVQLERPNGEVVLLEMRRVAEAHIGAMRENERLMTFIRQIADGEIGHGRSRTYAQDMVNKDSPRLGDEK